MVSPPGVRCSGSTGEAISPAACIDLSDLGAGFVMFSLKRSFYSFSKIKYLAITFVPPPPRPAMIKEPGEGWAVLRTCPQRQAPAGLPSLLARPRDVQVVLKLDSETALGTLLVWQTCAQPGPSHGSEAARENTERAVRCPRPRCPVTGRGVCSEGGRPGQLDKWGPWPSRHTRPPRGSASPEPWE